MVTRVDFLSPSPLIIIIYMYPATVVSTFLPIYSVWMYCTWTFCVAYSNTSFEIEIKLRLIICNYMPCIISSKHTIFLRISLLLFHFYAGPHLLVLHLKNGKRLEHVFLRPVFVSFSAPDFGLSRGKTRTVTRDDS